MMKQEFLKLISILLGEEPGYLVGDNQEKLHHLSQRFNDALQITKIRREISYGNDI